MKNQKILTTIYVVLFITTISYLSWAHGYRMLSSLMASTPTTPVEVLPTPQVVSAPTIPLTIPAPAITNPQPKSIKVRSSAIQVALLLDVSGSMNGLIEQAKSQLWKILNELAVYEKNEGEVNLEMALYAYGSTDIGREKDEIIQLSGFTTDMDQISNLLFGLKTSGSNEYCGQVIGESIQDLKWKTGHDNLKVIYIVGNESFTQGRVPFRSACAQAVESGIVVNTIFCGDKNNGKGLAWEAGAIAGNGVYLNIDHNQKTVYIETPYDDKINQLNADLNKTYIPMGEQGRAKMENQQLQDSNAASYSKSNMAERAKYKVSKKYKNSSWDLVDAFEKDKDVVNNTKNLPTEFQEMTPAEVEEEIEEIQLRRHAITTEMQTQNRLRDEFILNNQKTESTSNLDQSILESIGKLAKEKKFVKEKE